MEAEISWLRFSEPKKKKCDCCDRTMRIDLKVLISRQGLLIGDLELCGACAEAVAELLFHSAGEIVEQEWSFEKGGDLDGEPVDADR